MEILHLIHENLIFPNLQIGNKDDLFKILYEQLHQKGYVKESYFNGITEREKCFPTGLQLQTYGCALPHTDLEHVKKPAICVATLKDPIVFRSMENQQKEVNVSLVFMLALNKSEYQIAALKQLAMMIQDSNFLEEIVKAKESGEILNIIKSYSHIAV